MTDPAAVRRDCHARNSRTGEALGWRMLASPQDLVWETARMVASPSLDDRFADGGDAFATWLAYHRLLNQVRRIACRAVGTQHELVHVLKPWLEPLTVTVTPRNAAAAAWVRAAQLLEKAPVTYVSTTNERGGDAHASAGQGDDELLLPLAQLVLILAAAGETLSRLLTDDGTSLPSSALRLEARRLARHAPRLALAAVNTLEDLRRGPRGADDVGAESSAAPAR